MVKFDTEELIEAADRNYEDAWKDSAKLLQKEGSRFKLNQRQGKAHPVYDFIQESRQVLLSLGFDEIVLPIFIEEEEIFKEYGTEAALILDRVFYTAELPRPDIGLSKEKIEKIKTIIPGFTDFKKLQAILKSYKKGTVESDDLLEAMVEGLSIDQGDAAKLVNDVFHEFKALKPIPSKRTLRSHTTPKTSLKRSLPRSVKNPISLPSLTK